MWGFFFGDHILGINGDQLENAYCYTGKERGYDINGNVSPLTNQ